MNLYVETNFVFELAFEQEQSDSCQDILRFCEEANEETSANLFIPAYSLVEPYEKLRRQSTRRQELQRELDAELQQLTRTTSYTARIQSIQDISRIFLLSNDDERSRFNHYRNRIMNIAHVIPLSAELMTMAANFESDVDLSPQDAIVFASVVSHLNQSKDQVDTESCFLNRNSRDFENPDILKQLRLLNCTMIPRFDDGYRFLQSRAQ